LGKIAENCDHYIDPRSCCHLASFLPKHNLPWPASFKFLFVFE
jgi:hypothetical protein